jgi:hypothetical protein
LRFRSACAETWSSSWAASAIRSDRDSCSSRVPTSRTVSAHTRRA